MVDYPSLFVGFALGALTAWIVSEIVWIINNMRTLRWLGQERRKAERRKEEK